VERTSLVFFVLFPGSPDGEVEDNLIEAATLCGSINPTVNLCNAGARLSDRLATPVNYNLKLPTGYLQSVEISCL